VIEYFGRWRGSMQACIFSLPPRGGAGQKSSEVSLSHSPGLRGTSYPGKWFPTTPTPTGLHPGKSWRCRVDATPLGLGICIRVYPGWLRNPGLLDEAALGLWNLLHRTDWHHFGNGRNSSCTPAASSSFAVVGDAPAAGRLRCADSFVCCRCAGLQMGRGGNKPRR
jgi:hypothetical protein